MHCVTAKPSVFIQYSHVFILYFQILFSILSLLLTFISWPLIISINYQYAPRKSY